MASYPTSDTQRMSWSERQRLLKSRLRILRLVISAGLLPFSCVYCFCYTRQGCPVGWALSPILLCGTIALLVVTSITLAMKRPIGTGDIVRILCWGMVGMFLGRHLFGRGYYDHFYPNYGHVIDSLVSGILIVALLGIVISLFLLPQPKAPPPGSCQTCGYDLQGLTINRCPECGAVFKLPEQNTN